MTRMFRFCFAALLCSIIARATAVAPLFAQEAGTLPPNAIASPNVRPDSLDFKRFPAPREVVTFGVGVWGLYKGTLNTYFTTEFPSSLPTFNTANRTATLDVRPTIDFGVTLYAPMLFGEKIGANLDIGLSSYNVGTLYNTNFIFNDRAADSLRTRIRQAVGSNPDSVQKYLQPKYFTTLPYLTVSPLLNFGGFLVGANIGIPFGDATVETPANAPLGLSQSTLSIPQRLLKLMIEPRVGVQVPIIATRFGTLFLNANISVSSFDSPLSDSGAVILDNHLRAALNAFPFAPNTERYRFNQTTTGRTANIDTLRVNPISASIGLSFLISVGNNNDQVDEIMREERVTDSLRITNSVISRQLETSRQRSIELADKAITTIIESSKISDRIAVLEKEKLEKQKTALKTELTDTKKKVFQALFGAITGTNEDGSETPENPTVRIEQFQAKTTKTILPVVYFDQGSALVSTRYKRIQSSERESYKLPSDPFASSFSLYPNVLNIVGKRLAGSSAKLTLTGFQSNDETDAKLAEKRVETIAAYLQDVWKIPASRITRTISKQTGNASPEARRVDIASDNADITAPLALEYTARLANPPVLNIGLDINTGAGLKQWELEIQQIVNNQGTTLKDTTGGATFPPRFVWRLNDEPATMPQSSEPVTMRLGAFDINNAAAPDAPLKTIKVEQITLEQKRANKTVGDKSVQQFDVLFTNTLTDLDASSRRAFEAAKADITPQSRVLVTVYGGNASVSAKRVAQALNLDARSAILRDAGTPLVSSQQPEGRAYNQLVRIRVETPLK
jgi:hypothetical protein